MNDHPNAPDTEDGDQPARSVAISGMDMAPRQTKQEIADFDQEGEAAVERNELRQAIAAAREYPRSIEQWAPRAKALVLSSMDAADEAIYALPPKKDPVSGKMKVIEGPSIRFAEAIVYPWGNYRAATRIAHEGQDFITLQGVFYDLETNALTSMQTARSIKGKHGRYGQDMIRLTAAAGMSIALRNAILRAIPKALWYPLYLSARAMVAGDYKHLTQRVESAMRQLQKMGAEEPKVLAALNIERVADFTPEHIVILRGMATAIRDGEATVEQLFPDDVPAMFGVERVDIGKKLRDGKENGNGVQTDGGTEGKAAPRQRKKAAEPTPQVAGAPAASAATGTAPAASEPPAKTVDEPAAAAVGAAVPAAGQAAGTFAEDERILIDEFRTALDDMDSDLEIAAAVSEFAGSLENARPEVRAAVSAIEEARKKAVADKKQAALRRL